MSERVYGLERCPWHQKHFRFGVRASPGGKFPLISAERWGAAIEDEVATHVQGGFPLPMGMEREDRCE